MSRVYWVNLIYMFHVGVVVFVVRTFKEGTKKAQKMEIISAKIMCAAESVREGRKKDDRKRDSEKNWIRVSLTIWIYMKTKLELEKIINSLEDK